LEPSNLPSASRRTRAALRKQNPISFLDKKQNKKYAKSLTLIEVLVIIAIIQPRVASLPTGRARCRTPPISMAHDAALIAGATS
jgi:hypothetical protein